MAFKIPASTIQGKKVADLAVPEALFTAPVNENLLQTALRVYLHNQRQKTNPAQTRADVNKTRAKVWKQKGTGRARHGSRSAPLFVGGGQAHGPKGNENYKRTLSKRMRRQALLAALSLRATDKAITVLTDLDKIEAKTKSMRSALSAAKQSDSKILMILDKPHRNLLQASRNIQKVAVTQAARLNVYELIHADQIWLHPEAIKIMESTYLSNKKEIIAKETAEPKVETKKKTIKKEDK